MKYWSIVIEHVAAEKNQVSLQVFICSLKLLYVDRLMLFLHLIISGQCYIKWEY